MKVRSTLLWALVLTATLTTQASFAADIDSDSRGKKPPQKEQQQQAPQKSGKYPLGPDPELTPGKLCDRPAEQRYPEHISYCTRDVDTSTKKAVIQMYDIELGFTVQQMDRGLFKIDHFFPLCAGGSNDPENLWPQHESVYKITDPLEPAICEKMAQGRLKQAEALKLVIEAKYNLHKAPDIIAYVQHL